MFVLSKTSVVKCSLRVARFHILMEWLVNQASADTTVRVLNPTADTRWKGGATMVHSFFEIFPGLCVMPLKLTLMTPCRVEVSKIGGRHL